jgi:eukaryotic-like serine/threonine-protein kinase
MFDTLDVIDGQYIVTGECSSSGGMGTIVFVDDINNDSGESLVLKYCKILDDETKNRFRREIRFLNEFRDNPKVVQIIDSNLEYDYPYFVMKYYPEGDLISIRPALENDYTLQEKVFNQMIDCIHELHIQNKYHRDIKPQNFLRNGDQIIVSDFGLSTEVGSSTAMTTPSQWWGTHGYIPPEFVMDDGGFHNADAASDIFMLGKSFYVLLSGQDNPQYLLRGNIPDALFLIIQRCCEVEKSRRYQSLAELRQNLKLAFDVLVGRDVGTNRALQLLTTINSRIEKDNQFNEEEIKDFIDAYITIPVKEGREKIAYDFKDELFHVLTNEAFQPQLNRFLNTYKEMAEEGAHGWSYAEVIARRMSILFEADAVSNQDKALALKIAILSAQRQSRFAAMDVCNATVLAIEDESLAVFVRQVLLEYRDTFIAHNEAWQARSGVIQQTLIEIQPVK